jgi:hypothetical protein
VAAFLARDEVVVERMTKKGVRGFDARGAVVALRVADITDKDDECAILEVVLRHGSPSVRPDDVLAGIREASGLSVGSAAMFERLAQGPLDEGTGTVGDPLTPDRDTV